jgi:hypothetical protein
MHLKHHHDVTSWNFGLTERISIAAVLCFNLINSKYFAQNWYTCTFCIHFTLCLHARFCLIWRLVTEHIINMATATPKKHFYASKLWSGYIFNIGCWIHNKLKSVDASPQGVGKITWWSSMVCSPEWVVVSFQYWVCSWIYIVVEFFHWFYKISPSAWPHQYMKSWM